MTTPPSETVDALRAFNRRYTRLIGVLDRHLHDSTFSLAEARVLYEIASRSGITAGEIGAGLDVDTGYLSRLLARLEEQGLIGREPSGTDRRQRALHLTARGRKAYAALEASARASMASMLAPLSPEQRERLIGATQTVLGLLEQRDEYAGEPVRLRSPAPGDLGWIVERHGALYATEYGWPTAFEALVAGIVTRYVQEFDPAREACWIAERSGERLGSVFVMRKSDTVAQLRLLLVEPQARGLGIGRRLVEECIAFSRARGYRTVSLWTQSILVEARGLYAALGFVRVESAPHRVFNVDLTGETWELALR